MNVMTVQNSWNMPLCRVLLDMPHSRVDEP